MMFRTQFPLFSLVIAASACADDAVTGPTPAGLERAEVVSVSQITAVMSNLNSPRGLAFGPEGSLYVTEAGTSQSTGACVPFTEGTTLQTKCYSGTGSVSRLRNGEQHRIVSGLPSTFITASGFASGPQDISFEGLGNALVVLGWGGEPNLRANLGPAALAAGTLIRLQPGRTWRVVADVTAFEGSHNPAGGVVDSNPYGVLAEPGRSFVVDAGGNSLVEVAANGNISLVAIFPRTTAPPPFLLADAVPTRVRRGPGHELYVSTLSGVPFQAGSAAIYVVRPGQAPQVYAGGFKTITDFAFAPDGTLYVLQFATAPVFFGGTGALIRVAPNNGTRTTVTTALDQPTGIAIDADGIIYVSNRGTSVGAGQVLRITQ